MGVFWRLQIYFVIGENLRKQALSKNLNAAHSGKRDQTESL